jgi:threonyl-tRNA synthetase
VKVLPITDSVNDYARQTVDVLREHDIRAELDSRSEKIGAKIRDAELLKVPYMFILGPRETESGTVSIRKHRVGDVGVQSIEDAIGLLKNEIASRGRVD